MWSIETSMIMMVVAVWVLWMLMESNTFTLNLNRIWLIECFHYSISQISRQRWIYQFIVLRIGKPFYQINFKSLIFLFQKISFVKRHHKYCINSRKQFLLLIFLHHLIKLSCFPLTCIVLWWGLIKNIFVKILTKTFLWIFIALKVWINICKS